MISVRVLGRTVSLDFYFPCYMNNLCFRIAARCASAQAADIIFYLQDHYKISLYFIVQVKEQQHRTQPRTTVYVNKRIQSGFMP
jgi:D-alanyl-lipoteichoic acid acyltransferase DltB (MBOAT superfamily)